MPNWCCTNYILRGDKEDIKRFCDTVNSIIDKEDVSSSFFGKFWLGNLAKAFGYDPNEWDGIRGALDPNPDAIACFVFSCSEPAPLIPESMPDNEARISFSTITAWSPSDWFEKMLSSDFPDVLVSYKSTDEFGNFHICNDCEAFGTERYEIEQVDEEIFTTSDIEIAAKMLSELTSASISAEDIKTEKFYDSINEFNAAHEDSAIYFIEWKDE